MEFLAKGFVYILAAPFLAVAGLIRGIIYLITGR